MAATAPAAFHATRAYYAPSRLRLDYRRFHRLAVTSGDVDPVYPVYRALAGALGLDPAGRAWLVFCHVAYYHAGSALAAFAATRTAPYATLAPLDLPVGTERRAHWTRPRLAAHLAGLQRAALLFGGDLHAWAMDGLPGDPGQAWHHLAGRLAALPGNGRWAAYKTTEMLAEVCGIPAQAPDMGHAHSTGPRRGLVLLHPAAPGPDENSALAVKELDVLSRRLVDELRAAGLPATMATAETTLCDFHALHAGRYYVGHDIDLMQAQVRAVRPPLAPHLMDARAAALPGVYLGELGGWTGPDPRRRRHYRDTGVILERTT
jgi:Alpha-glutamyl/putrescinyl thymine pyrophosphorylase clade 2